MLKGNKQITSTLNNNITFSGCTSFCNLQKSQSFHIPLDECCKVVS